MSVRIISGERRGAVLQTPEGLETRPLRDRIRQALFNMLRPELHGRRVLDAFAGSGAVGLEALSNGAAHVTFVEPWTQAQGVIRSNIRKLRYEDRATLLPGSSPEAFARTPLRPGGPLVDLVFLMPPYHSGLWRAVLEDAEVLRRLAGETTAVLEIHKEEPFAPVEGWFVKDDRSYGITRLVRLERQIAP